MIRRHMRLKGTVLVRAAIKPRMRSNAIAVKEDFYRAAGHPDIDLLLDILIGAGVVLCIHADVVVVLNCGNSPCGQLERMSGQRKQKELLFLKRGSSAPVFLLKRLMIELVQSVPYSFIQLSKRKKLLVSQSCEYKCRNNPYRAFDSGFILRGSRTGGNDCRSVMFGHFLVGTVNDQFIPCVFRYTRFQVIRRQYPRDAAETAICVYMRCDPVFLPHVLERLHVGISAVGQNGNEQVF